MNNLTPSIDGVKSFLGLPEWLLGIFFGSLLTFVLTVAWDHYKFSRDNKRKDEVVLSVLYEEISINSAIVSNNEKLIERELTILHLEQSLINPLQLLRSKAWDLVIMNLPQVLLNDRDILRKIREIYLIVDEIDETIRSRENYRLANEAMTNFTSRLKKYDEMLLERGRALSRFIGEIKKILRDESLNT